MSTFFLLNNVHFALELVGALVFLMMTWLFFDAYLISRDKFLLFRSISFAFLAGWQVIHAFALSADLINYAGGLAYALGLLLLVISFLLEPKPLLVNSIIILPAFAALAAPLYSFAAFGFFVTALLIFRRYRREKNKVLVPFLTGFLFLAASNALLVFPKDGGADFVWIASLCLETIGFLGLAWWAAQYIRLRLKESLIIIFISITFFMATAVTLAFSTIFVGNIESATKANLLTNARVLDYAISRLKEEALAKTRFIAEQPDIQTALEKNDFAALEKSASAYLEREQIGFLTLVGENGNVMLRAHALSQREDNVSGERAVEEALKGAAFVTIESSPAEKFSIRAGAPIVSGGKIKGALVAGFPLDNAMVDGIKRITGLEMSVFERDILAATTVLNQDGRTRSVGIREASQEVKDSVLTKGGQATLTVSILSRTFLASYLPIRDADNRVVGMISAAKPQQEILEIANATNRLTFVTVAILMLILIAPMYFITKRLLAGII